MTCMEGWVGEMGGREREGERVMRERSGDRGTEKE